MTKQAFIFAGGGSGGHLYPGLAIAEQICELSATSVTHFVCSDRPIDDRILSEEGVPFTPIPARPFSVRPGSVVKLAWTWGTCVRRVRAVIRKLRGEGAEVTLVAMGGFAAAPAAHAARAERIGVHLVNLDAVPGKANRWLARHADVVWTALSGPAVPEAWTRVRPIVRRRALPGAESASAYRERLGLEPGLRTLLVTGGSQGASTINRTMIALCRVTPPLFAGWQIYHQAGPTDTRELIRAYGAAGIRHVVTSYCTDMAAAWGAADAAVGRAGAGTVAEAWGSLTPTLFMPYPWHRDDHQRANAAPLVDAGGALLIRDTTNPEANADGCASALRRLLDVGEAARMREALRGLGPTDGAATIARALLAGP